jgi:hypothetical protein
MLQTASGAQLIDVRTSAEWAYVGQPDLSSIGGRLVRVEWQSFPSGTANSAFREMLEM